MDGDGNPWGGISEGRGFTIAWQNGPVNAENPANGAFVEDLLEAVLDRMFFYQRSKFACPQNAVTISHLELAIASQRERTKDRQSRGVEGSYEV